MMVPMTFLRKMYFRLRFEGRIFSVVEIEPSSSCNLRCGSCPNSVKRRDYVEMPREIWEKVVSELSEMKYSGEFSPQYYNEPLTDKRIVELMAFARRNLPDARILMFSNFTLMTPELYGKLYDSIDEFIVTVDEPLIKASVEKLMVSIDPTLRRKIRTRSISEGGLSNRGGAIEIDKREMAKAKRCSLPMNYLVIDATGNVRICYNDFSGETSFGNVKDRTIREIWFSEEFISERADAFAGDFKFNICKNCFWTR